MTAYSFFRKFTRFAYFLVCVPLSAQNTPSYVFSTATGENGTSLPIKETALLFSQLPREARSISETAPAGVSILRSGNYRVDRRESDLSMGLSLQAVAETSLSLTNAAFVPGYTLNHQRPYSKTELQVINEKIYPTLTSAGTESTVRLTGFLNCNVTGIFPPERFWRNSGLTILSITASVRKVSNDQILSTKGGSFTIYHALNNTSTLVTNTVIATLGGSNGAWNELANNGTGFIEVSVPSNAYVLVQVTLNTMVEITNFASSSGNGLSSFRSEATAYVNATNISGGGLSTELGLSKLRQYFPIKSYSSQELTAAPLTLSEIPTSGLAPVFEMISGPASLLGNVLTLNGTRGQVIFGVNQPGNNTYAPTGTTRVFNVLGTEQTITVPIQGARAANHLPFSPGATSDSGLPITYQVLSGPATTDGVLITPTGGLGTAVIRATQPGSDTYEPAIPVDTNIFFEPAVPSDTEQTISFPSLLNANLGEGQLLLATSSSGLPVTFTIVEGSVTIGGINHNILIPTEPGLIRVRASQSGGFNGTTSYLPAPEVERTLTATSLFLNALIAEGIPPEKRGATDDADGDGMANLLEFALAGNPADPSDKPILDFKRSPEGVLSFEYHRARNDVTYQVQISSNLENWTITGVDQGTPDSENKVIATAPANGSARFMRLDVRYP